MASDEARQGRRLAGAIRVAGLAVVGLVMVAAAAALWLGWGDGLTVQAFEETIRAWGMWGVLASIGLMVVHSFVPFPAELVTFANGLVYGLFWGTVVTWTGAMLGAFAAFGVARGLGRPFVEGLVARRDWHALDDWAAREGWQVLLISRFIPVIAFNLINYAAGLTRVTWWTFAWTTGLGILPLTVLFVLMGDHIEHLGWGAWAVLLAGGLVLWLALRRRLRPVAAADRTDE
jgi:uncharacterized membrane protein YdjX (TVP38/TMEM64 family)